LEKTKIRGRKLVSENSDKMLDLLQQISVLKELDERYQAGDQDGIVASERKERNKKRQQIHDEMEKLASRTRQRVETKRAR
jgi:hypothetical protein